MGDCFDVMANIPDSSVDMVLCDLPYGTTQNKWDAVIPFEPLWREYWRLVRPGGAVVLTAAQPFTSALVMSQVERFKYDWTWRKLGKPTGHLNAKKQPLRNKEDVLIFAQGQTIYNPQFTEGKPYDSNKAGKNKQNGLTDNYGDFGTHREGSDGKRYPLQVIDINRDERTIHPTQKPVALFEYLIKTYTHEGMTVLDNTAGSGTTAIAAHNSGRRWICIERDPGYFLKAIQRVMVECAE